MRASAALPPGVHALFFEPARRRRALEAAMAAHLEAAGFAEVVLPILDYFEPYEPLLPAAARGELYRFVDRDGELLCLRSDFTPLLARLLAPRLAGLALPLRLYYRGDVVRREEERAGRRSEIGQLGAELVGAPGEEAEEEMLRRFLELLDGELPALPEGEGIEVVLGFAGALDRLLLASPDPAGLAAAVARRERGAVRRLGGSPVLLEVVKNGLPAGAAGRAALGEAAAARLERLLELKGDLGRDFPRIHATLDLAEFALHTLDPRLEPAGPAEASGPRAYYDGLVFRAFARGSALPLGGGGRYDRLFSRLGAQVAAVGFSISLDRLPALSGAGGEEAP